MAKILVVDDESDLEFLIKQKFRKQIREHHYEFVFAINGKHALEKLEEHHDVDLVLSDINMPEMDGLTLLSKLQEKHNLLKAIIISAYGDMDNIRTAMNRGAFDFLTKPIDFGDLEITIEKTLEHVNSIKKTIQAIKENNILKMYVDESVLNFMNSDHIESSLFNNEIINGTVIFVDICGFTYITESQPANKVVQMLNEYFDVMVSEIIKEDGIIDKFIGDAVMALFKGEYHIDRAIDASLAIKKKLEHSEVHLGADIFRPKVSIGINSGEMVWGNFGSTTLKRLDYTVIGDVVNVAARLQSAAEKGQILISSDAHSKIKGYFECKEAGKLTLKNKKEPIQVFEVNG
jgi:adenylate cyclase